MTETDARKITPDMTPPSGSHKPTRQEVTVLQALAHAVLAVAQELRETER